jgi:hypothetical protein
VEEKVPLTDKLPSRAEGDVKPGASDVPNNGPDPLIDMEKKINKSDIKMSRMAA